MFTKPNEGSLKDYNESSFELIFQGIMSRYRSKISFRKKRLRIQGKFINSIQISADAIKR